MTLCINGRKVIVEDPPKPETQVGLKPLTLETLVACHLVEYLVKEAGRN